MRRRPDSPGSKGRAAPGGGEESTVEAAAVRLLARREHSTQELRRKLLSKGHPAAVVAGVIEKLSAKRLVSDERFVASFVHHHARRGQGPARIRAELRQHGVSSESIEQELAGAGCDWEHLAAEVRQRRFGAARPASPDERAKQARFLQYRGFDAGQIRAVLSSQSSDPDPATEFDPEDLDPGGFDPDGAV